MRNKIPLPEKLLEKLQSQYEDFPDRDISADEITTFESGLKEFLTAYGEDLVLDAGETLFLENDPADGLYWIASGVVAVLQGNLEKPRLLTFRTVEHVVGEIALLENIHRTATIAAITETRFKYLGQEKFQGLLSLIPGFGVELLRLLSMRLREVKPAEYSDGMYDHLTGAMSRQAFDVRLHEEIERAQLYRYTFSLVFLDLDYFKNVNDTYGHARGDEVLIEFANRVMSDLRTTDTLFRYGGDEFVLILQGIDEERGPAFVQRLLNHCISEPISGEPPVTISFSAGIAYFPQDGETSRALLEAADKRVYNAKADGRGRVTGKLG
jgi:diguanylate cyclase (GGDEF)-like protein